MPTRRSAPNHQDTADEREAWKSKELSNTFAAGQMTLNHCLQMD